MAEQFEKEVRFDKYCGKCVHKKLKETLDPCNECLDNPYNENTEKPRYFKEDPNAKTN